MSSSNVRKSDFVEDLCVHCSLLQNNRNEGTDTYYEPKLIYIVPGIFTFLLSIRWVQLLVTKWSQESVAVDLEQSGLPAPPKKCTFGWNLSKKVSWEGFYKIILSLLSLVYVFSKSENVSLEVQLLIMTIFGFFFISGLVDVLIFHCGYSVIPEGIQSLILSMSFLVEVLAYYSEQAESKPEKHCRVLLIAAIVMTSICALLEIIMDNRLVKFGRCYFASLQSTWSIHLAFISWDMELPLSSVLFLTHAAIIFILFHAYLLTFNVIYRCQYRNILQKGGKGMQRFLRGQSSSSRSSTSSMTAASFHHSKLRPPVLASQAVFAWNAVSGQQMYMSSPQYPTTSGPQFFNPPLSPSKQSGPTMMISSTSTKGANSVIYPTVEAANSQFDWSAKVRPKDLVIPIYSRPFAGGQRAASRQIKQDSEVMPLASSHREDLSPIAKDCRSPVLSDDGSPMDVMATSFMSQVSNSTALTNITVLEETGKEETRKSD